MLVSLSPHAFAEPIGKDWTQTAREMAPTEFKDPRASADVGRKLESAKGALKKQESKQGASVEEITAELTRARKAYETAMNEVKTMVALNKVRVYEFTAGSSVSTDLLSALSLVIYRSSVMRSMLVWPGGTISGGTLR